MSVCIERNGPVTVITIDRPDRRNAVDVATAGELDRAFGAFEKDAAARVAVLTGNGGHFCAGADLKVVAGGEDTTARVASDRPGPMGPTRRESTKPVIAAVEGHAVAGGLELACWCDLRVAGRSAVFGVFCRRFGVPLVDGGTVRLPRLIGHSRAMDMILTGRPVGADEALSFGLVNRLVDDERALEAALALARSIAGLPQHCMNNDRRSALRQWSMNEPEALAAERELGLDSIRSGESAAGASEFAAGRGRGGRSLDD